MFEDVRRLTRAQVRWIENRACSLYETHTWGSALEQAIHELAAKPGTRGWCEKEGIEADQCEWWGLVSHRDYRGGTFSPGLCYCQHKDAREGVCPKKESDE